MSNFKHKNEMGFLHGLVLLNLCSNSILSKPTQGWRPGDTQTKQIPLLRRKGVLCQAGHVDEGAFWDNVCAGIFHSVLACR